MNQRLSPPAEPTLRPGDRLTRPEFHARYLAYPDDTKVELIRGVVYMTSPQRNWHGEDQLRLDVVVGLYRGYTPGLAAGVNNTTILDDDSEPQPDLLLRILPECGGQTHLNEGDYVVGAPEFLAEVSHAGRAVDLGPKRDAYRDAGVHEYVVLVEDRELVWFDFRAGDEIVLGGHGVYHSRAFPGLWLNGPALFAGDVPRLVETLNAGLAAPEHADFVRRLATARRPAE